MVGEGEDVCTERSGNLSFEELERIYTKEVEWDLRAV